MTYENLRLSSKCPNSIKFISFLWKNDVAHLVQELRVVRPISAYRVYLALSFGRRLAFYTYATMSLVYQVSVVGLHPLQLVLVGTVLEVSYFLLEIPTGVVADVYSRRLSILIGFILTGLGFILAGAIPRFDTLLLSQVIWGCGETFLSGATEAWIADELTYQQAPSQHRQATAKTAAYRPDD